MADEFREKVRAFAERRVVLAPRCTNEESTKHFLIIPFLSLLGYDVNNPDEIGIEYNADFSEKYKNRVDYAILKNGSPVIAIECKTLGMSLRDERGQLRSYFNAAPTVKMGVITDGLVYEFYAESDEPNMMDQSAFLSLDLREVAKGKIEDSLEEGVKSLRKDSFDPENIGAEAKRKLILQHIVGQINQLAHEPNEAFTRVILQKAGVSHVRTKALSEYRELIKRAFHTFVNNRIIEKLDLPKQENELDMTIKGPEVPVAKALVKPDEGIVTTETEIGIFGYAKRRLSFLVKDEHMFEEIDKINYHDYKGKFVVYYKRERVGRLFDFYEGVNTRYRFDFGPHGGEVATNNLLEIDKPLLTAFVKRIEDSASSVKRRED